MDTRFYLSCTRAREDGGAGTWLSQAPSRNRIRVPARSGTSVPSLKPSVQVPLSPPKVSDQPSGWPGRGQRKVPLENVKVFMEPKNFPLCEEPVPEVGTRSLGANSQQLSPVGDQGSRGDSLAPMHPGTGSLHGLGYCGTPEQLRWLRSGQECPLLTNLVACTGSPRSQTLFISSTWKPSTAHKSSVWLPRRRGGEFH